MDTTLLVRRAKLVSIAMFVLTVGSVVLVVGSQTVTTLWPEEAGTLKKLRQEEEDSAKAVQAKRKEVNRLKASKRPNDATLTKARTALHTMQNDHEALTRKVVSAGFDLKIARGRNFDKLLELLFAVPWTLLTCFVVIVIVQGIASIASEVTKLRLGVTPTRRPTAMDEIDVSQIDMDD